MKDRGICLVVWDDAQQSDSWGDTEEGDPLCRTESVGFCKQADKVVFLSQSVLRGDLECKENGPVLAIPRDWIVSITDLPRDLPVEVV